MKDNLHCSFCGKSQKIKIASPTVYICNENNVDLYTMRLLMMRYKRS